MLAYVMAWLPVCVLVACTVLQVSAEGYHFSLALNS